MWKVLWVGHILFLIPIPQWSHATVLKGWTGPSQALQKERQGRMQRAEGRDMQPARLRSAGTRDWMYPGRNSLSHPCPSPWVLQSAFLAALPGFLPGLHYALIVKTPFSTCYCLQYFLSLCIQSQSVINPPQRFTHSIFCILTCLCPHGEIHSCGAICDSFFKKSFFNGQRL